MANRRRNPVIRFCLAVGTIVLCVAALEMAMRYKDWPHAVVSGWRATGPGPVNQFGWRGQPGARHSISDFVVVLTGADKVECLACPPDETLDVMLGKAVRRFNPHARVVTLGSTGYGQDQQYLALQEYFSHEHADLVIDWASIADDVPANTFRTGSPRTGEIKLKPTFAWSGREIRGPTEGIAKLIYRTKIATLLWPIFINLDHNWSVVLPPAAPGLAEPPEGLPGQSVDAALEEQRSNWSIWLTPRPPRVTYGIALTRALFRHMRDLATLNGARFAVLLTPSAEDAKPTAPAALRHDGHWFVADPAARDAAIAEVTSGFDPVILPPDAEPDASPMAERETMERLAAALNERALLSDMLIARPRH